MKIIASIICLPLLALSACAEDSPELANLAIASIRPVPYYLRLSDTNMHVVGANYLGYKVTEVTTNTITLTRESDGRPVTIIKGKPTTEQELVVLFVDASKKTRYPVVRIGEELNIGTQMFTLQSINVNGLSCTLRDADSGELLTITNQWVQQAGPAYPPQGVGSADP